MEVMVRLQVWFRSRRTEVAEAAVQSLRAVPALDEIEDRGAGGGPRGPGCGIEEFAFEGGEERLGQSVVTALPGAADRQADPEPVCQGGALPANGGAAVRLLLPRSEQRSRGRVLPGPAKLAGNVLPRHSGAAGMGRGGTSPTGQATARESAQNQHGRGGNEGCPHVNTKSARERRGGPPRKRKTSSDLHICKIRRIVLADHSDADTPETPPRPRPAPPPPLALGVIPRATASPPVRPSPRPC